MRIFLCVSTCLQCRWRKAKTSWFIPLYRYNTDAPPDRLFLNPSSSFLSPASSIQPHSSLIPSFLLCSLPSLDSSSHYRSAAFSPSACMLTSHHLDCHTCSAPPRYSVTWGGAVRTSSSPSPNSGLRGSPTQGQSFLSDWRPPRWTHFPIFIHHVRLQWCRVTLMTFLKISSRYQ